MLANKVLRRSLHRRHIQRRVIPAGFAGMDGKAGGAIDQHIAVAAPMGGKTRVKFVRHRMRPEYRDAVRQQGIHAAHPGRQRTFGLSIEMCHLLQRMHAGIGASRRDNRDSLTDNLTQGMLQRVLHGLPFRLALPAAIRAAVILHAQRDPHYPSHEITTQNQ